MNRREFAKRSAKTVAVALIAAPVLIEAAQPVATTELVQTIETKSFDVECINPNTWTYTEITFQVEVDEYGMPLTDRLWKEISRKEGNGQLNT